MTRKAVFDALRVALGRGLTAADVATMNNTLDYLGVPAEDDGMELGVAGAGLIQEFEGYAKDLGDGRVQSYPDPATGGAPWTIGWGTTGTDVVRGTIWTREKAFERFMAHVAEFSAVVRKAIGTTPTTQNQFDAMVSLCYNIGPGNFMSSTLLKKHTVKDYIGAQAQFALWNKANKKVLNGLVKRRAAEAALYGR